MPRNEAAAGAAHAAPTAAEPAAHRLDHSAAPGLARTAVLIVGMHRSGTSALTRILNLHGVALGDELLAPAADNPEGFWENSRVVAMHERLLADLGRSWNDPRPLPEHWQSSEAALRAADEIGAILDSEFPQPVLFAIKDPRLSEFLDLWLPALAVRGIRAAVVQMVRHPDEVADSLHRRDGWPRSLVRLLWARSAVAAIAGAETAARCAVRYDELLGDWTSVIERISRILDLRLPASPEIAAAVNDYLDPQSRHHAHATAATLQPAYVAELYAAMLEVAADGRWEALEALVQRYPQFYQQHAQVHAEYAGPVARIYASQQRVVELERQIVQMKAERLEARIQGQPAPVTGALLLEDAQRDDRVVAYYRASGDGYSEEHSRNVAWPQRCVEMKVSFEIPALREASYLRIDPSEFAGWFDVAGLTVDALPVQLATVIGNCSGSIVRSARDGGLSFVEDSNDPCVEIELPPRPEGHPDGPRLVTFEVAKRGVLSSFNTLSKVVSSGNQTLAGQLDAMAATLEGMRTSLPSEFNALRDWAAAHHAETGEKVSLLAGQATALVAQEAHRAIQHKDLAQVITMLGNEQGKIAGQVAQISTSLSALAGDIAVRQATLNEAQSEVAHEIAELQQQAALREVHAVGRQAVLEGMIEGLAGRLREASDLIHANEHALAAVESRIETLVQRGWTARVRRYLGREVVRSKEC